MGILNLSLQYLHTSRYLFAFSEKGSVPLNTFVLFSFLSLYLLLVYTDRCNRLHDRTRSRCSFLRTFSFIETSTHLFLALFQVYYFLNVL